ncbi:uncharacterized protein B0P05DRAFT_537030 [Gilbertella persicaria]|uniref:uncharacterized protein n=1 Tax=Gilbertella persicaria TaxID=101096 RepID=UPI00221FE381|nr:uncharacterized protein B0P05DRAFT_537030 [Gilbertella persicaria]KAI8083365.1 hypothetical protein B0P05DRAFT_537030 [Gilbertella persicaria]
MKLANVVWRNYIRILSFLVLVMVSLIMSTTIPFTFDRYKFHLKLYNLYQILKETDIDVQGNKEYLDLTPELVISFTDIDVRTLQHKIRRKLERARKQIEEGKEVLQAETMLSEAPIITISTSIIQYQAFLDLHLSRSNRSRRFYSSKKE